MSEKCYMIKYTGEHGASLILSTACSSRQKSIANFMQSGGNWTWGKWKRHGYSTVLVEVREIVPAKRGKVAA